LMKVRHLLPEILALPQIDKELVAQCEDYLRALGGAHILHLAATAPVGVLPGEYEGLLKRREIVLADATNLAVRGLVPADRLGELRGPVSPQATAFDVLAILKLLEAHEEQIGDKSSLTAEEKAQAKAQAERVLQALTARAFSDEEVAEATRQRQAAFTLFVRAYEEVKRGVVFLRWHEGDADELLPSLYSLKVGRRPRTTGSEVAKGSDSTGEAPTASSSGPGSGGVNGRPGPSTPVATTPSAPAASPIAPGLPGAEPFLPH